MTRVTVGAVVHAARDVWPATGETLCGIIFMHGVGVALDMPVGKATARDADCMACITHKDDRCD